MERHNEIVRQWKILKDISTRADCTVASLAQAHSVHRRTIYRDLDALQYAGFTLQDVRIEGTVYWRLDSVPFRGLAETGFTVSELCAFYVNRARFAAVGASPVEDDLQSALAKLTRSLSPAMREFLDRLTRVMTFKAEPGKRGHTAAGAKYQEDIVRATLEHRTLEMTYHSFSSRKVKQYRVEPYRLTFGNGGLYLYGFVPVYGQMRSFAVHRIQTLRLLEQHFSPVQELSGEPYQNSMGVFTGEARPVSILFSRTVAPYVEEGKWHPTQTVARQPDGSIVLTMNVCLDLALRSWILGFGHQARVLKPSSLAETILEELEEAREQYAPRMQFEMPPAIFDESQSRLPFQGSRHDTARHTEARQKRRGPGSARPSRHAN